MNKRLIAFFMIVVSICAYCLGCKIPANGEKRSSNNDVITKLPVVFTLPEMDAYNYTYVNTAWYCDKTDFSKATHNADGAPLPKKQDAVDVSFVGAAEKQYCIINDLKYVPILNPDPDNCAMECFFEWTADRRFFYEYANTISGGKLYSNTNTDNMEALIYIDQYGKELILVKESSSIADPERYSISDFGAVVIGTAAFDWAQNYEEVFAAHISGENAETVTEDIRFANGDNEIELTFECVSVPGLRYYCSGYLLNDRIYIYSRGKDSLVCINAVDHLKASYLTLWGN
ncbi:MAG: hypothetical protein IKZ82_00950 [Clostridia bacterium]|nr:hypothetical protein [Clostridia bacterium]